MIICYAVIVVFFLFSFVGNPVLNFVGFEHILSLFESELPSHVQAFPLVIIEEEHQCSLHESDPLHNQPHIQLFDGFLHTVIIKFDLRPIRVHIYLIQQGINFANNMSQHIV